MLNFIAPAALILTILLSLIVILILVFIFFYTKIKQGEAIIRTGIGGTRIISSGGLLILPVLHRKETVDLTIKRVDINRLSEDALITQDNSRIELKASFYVRVNRAFKDIENVATAFGARRTFSLEEIKNLFEPKLVEILKYVAKENHSEEILETPETFKMNLLKCIGQDINGFLIDDCAIYDIQKLK